ncbi:MAG: hypothetical protein AAGF23_22280, partial [Acidobacteriota bacterium]
MARNAPPKPLLRRFPCALALAAALVAPAADAQIPNARFPGGGQAADAADGPQADAVRLLWTPGTVARGRVEVEALPLARDVRRLVFLLDGAVVAERSKPPWRERLRFADPATLQQLTVRAYADGDRLLGEDTVEVNRVRLPFRVLLEDATVDGVSGRVAVPRGARLASMLVELDGEEVATGTAEAFDVPLAARNGQVVRVEATLEDGRVIEDARVLGAAGDVASIDVRLVQLQVLVTGRDGRPLQDLAAADFEL